MPTLRTTCALLLSLFLTAPTFTHAVNIKTTKKSGGKRKQCKIGGYQNNPALKNPTFLTKRQQQAQQKRLNENLRNCCCVTTALCGTALVLSATGQCLKSWLQGS